MPHDLLADKDLIEPLNPFVLSKQIASLLRISNYLKQIRLIGKGVGQQAIFDNYSG
jgi:hypothetical protein